jgi:hypothetical protein
MSRRTGCLVWLIAAIIVLIAASLLFGGFQKGTKANGERKANTRPAVTLVTHLSSATQSFRDHGVRAASLVPCQECPVN